GVPALTDNEVSLLTPDPLTLELRGATTLDTSTIGEQQTLIVHDADGAGTLTTQSSGALYNYGTIVLESVEDASPIELLLPGGSFQNLGTLTINAGAGGSRRVLGSLFNDGHIEIGADTLIGRES